MSKILPQRKHILVEIEEVAEKRTDAGIILTVDDKKKDYHGVYGTVVAVGPNAEGYAAGDRVIVNRYDMIGFGDDPKTANLRVCKDEAVLAIVKE